MGVKLLTLREGEKLQAIARWSARRPKRKPKSKLQRPLNRLPPSAKWCSVHCRQRTTGTREKSARLHAARSASNKPAINGCPCRWS
jgi:hypothetical protein